MASIFSYYFFFLKRFNFVPHTAAASVTYRQGGMTWFKAIFGFDEPRKYEDVRALFQVKKEDDGSIIVATKDDDKRTFFVGRFDTPSVAELKTKLQNQQQQGISSTSGTQNLTFRHAIGDAGQMICDRDNTGAVFQAASQFNCLEMVGPQKTPEDGITGYIYDGTQGPACALACPAGTLYRNYFVNGNGQGGEGKQLDLLEDIGVSLGNSGTTDSAAYWVMKNGYAIPIDSGAMKRLQTKIQDGCVDVDSVRSKLRVGVHWSTETEMKHEVAQVYCSALPVGYHYQAHADDWADFAQIVLDGTYEATLAVAAILARERQTRVRVFLTKIGGGVFGNKADWICEAIQKSLQSYIAHPIDVVLVHYGDYESPYKQRLPVIGDGEK